jgi:predicted membrane channel-forming protein YqfA (hemolysin III family)
VPEDRERDLDQEWSELLEEHRVAMPGAQVLFTFLLILPFQNRFSQLTDAQEGLYFAAFLCATIAIVLLITPTASHRIRWRQHDKEALLRYSTMTSIAALVFLAFAMTASVYLVADFLFGLSTTVVATAVIAVLFSWFWFTLPILRRLRA